MAGRRWHESYSCFSEASRHASTSIVSCSTASPHWSPDSQLTGASLVLSETMVLYPSISYLIKHPFLGPYTWDTNCAPFLVSEDFFPSVVSAPWFRALSTFTSVSLFHFCTSGSLGSFPPCLPLWKTCFLSNELGGNAAGTVSSFYLSPYYWGSFCPVLRSAWH